MPFRIQLPQSRPTVPPMVFVGDPDGEFTWSARASEATLFESDEADAIVARFNLHEAEVRGVRNQVGVSP